MTSEVDGPLVTVAIPTYRRPDMLRQAIDSALAQTYRNIEVLVSDSAADPQIAALVHDYGDPRLQYRHNGGVSDLSTNGKAMYMAAKGEFIGTLHDDDVWEPNFLELLVPPLLGNPEVVISFGDHSVIDVDGTLRPDLMARIRNREGVRPGLHQPFYDLATSIRAVPLTVAAVFRAAAVDWSQWHAEAATAYDLWLAYLLARDGAAAWYVPARVSRYRQHPTAASSVARVDEAAIWCFERILADDRLKSAHAGIRRAAAMHYTGRALTELREGGPRARRRSADDLRAALRGEISARTLIVCALWPLPLKVRRWVIDMAARVRFRGQGRGSGPASVSS